MISFIRGYKNRIESSEIAKRFLGGAVWSVFGTFVSSGITLVMWMIVARLMGKESYGQLVVVQSTLAMVGVFAGFGIGAAATRYAAELKVRDPQRLGHILTLAERSILLFGAIGTCALIACSDWVASNYLNRSSLALPLSIAAGTIFFTALDAYQKSVLIGVESMRAYALGTIFGVLISMPIMIYAVYKYELIGAVFGLLISAGIQALISRYQIYKELKKYNIVRNGKGCLRESHVLWHFAFPALLAGALVGPAHWIVQAILAHQPGGYLELAVLGVAMQWFQIIQFIPSAASKVILPVLTDSLTDGNNEFARKVLLHSVISNVLITLPFIFAMLFFGRYIYGLYGMYGDDRGLTLPLAATAALISVCLNPIGTLLAAKSRMWLGACMNLVWAISYIVTAKYFIAFGANGVLVALGLGYIVHSIWVFVFAYGDLWKK